MTLNVTVMSSVSPAARDAKAPSEGSTDSVVPSSVTPAGRSLTFVTESTASLSTSDAPSRRSSVTTSSPSAAATRAAPTTGASFSPVTVSVVVEVVTTPSTVTSTVNETSWVSPAAKSLKSSPASNVNVPSEFRTRSPPDTSETSVTSASAAAPPETILPSTVPSSLTSNSSSITMGSSSIITGPASLALTSSPSTKT